MFDSLLSILEKADDLFWSYIGVYLVLLPGIYLTLKSRFFQFKVLAKPKSLFTSLAQVSKNKHDPGINPFKLYFASVGGMIGLGNIVIIVTSVTAGGPGVLFWLWFSAFAGMIIKYAEIYLGIKYRKPNKKGGFDGGPMFYLKAAFKTNIAPLLACLLLCVYGIEISQFKIISDTMASTFQLDTKLVTGILLLLVLYASIGGIRRLANTCSILMPMFIIMYVAMCLWIIGVNIHKLPETLATVVKGAFVGHAPLAGFVGSTAMMAMHFGIARAVYSGDIAIGYDSVVQSETKSQHPELQAKLAIFGQLTDTVICTCSILVVLITGVWSDPLVKEPSAYIIKALSMHFSHVDLFMTLLFFAAGYTTIIAYFAVGMKSAKYMHRRIGPRIYIAYAIIAFIATNYVNQYTPILIMSLSGGLLVMLNIAGIIKLRNDIKFK